MKEHDWRLVPLAAAVWAGAWLGIGGSLPLGHLLGLGILTVFFAAVSWHKRRRLTAFLIVAGYLALALAGLRASAVEGSVVAQWAQQKRIVTAVIQVTAEGRLLPAQRSRPDLVIATGTVRRVSVRDHSVEVNQAVTVFASGKLGQDLLSVVPGATYQVRAKAGPSDPGDRHPMVLTVMQPLEQVEPEGPLDSVVNHLRSGLRKVISGLPGDQSALVPSLVVGDTYKVSPELKEQFRHTSLSHLLAVSGANLTLMLGVVLGVGRAVGVRGWAVRGIAVAGVGFFVVLCRFEPSVIRAAVMGLITLAAMGMGRGRSGVRAIAITVTAVMFVDPWLAKDFAFALSVSACLGIVVWSQPWARAMWWAPRWLAEAWCVPLAAQIATQPLITMLSGEVSVVGVFANILAGPCVGPATVLGIAAAATSFWTPLGVMFAQLAGWAVEPIIWIARIAAAADGAIVSWPGTALGIAVMVALLALLVWLTPHVLRRRLASAVIALALLLLVWFRPGPLGWPGPWQAVFCDVGQGDATVLRAAPNTAVLVDTGPDEGLTLRCLRQLGITKIPVVVLTHFHADHITGVHAVLDQYRPELLVISPLRSPVHEAEKIVRHAEQVGTRVDVAQAGQEFTVGDVSWRTVNAWLPPLSVAVGEIESSVENDSSVIGVADISGLKILLPGDAEFAGQRRALQLAATGELAVDIVKLPHHGAKQQEPGFLEATGASVAIVSAGKNNDYGHPSRLALDITARLGMTVAQTNQGGSISVVRNRDHIEIRERKAA